MMVSIFVFAAEQSKLGPDASFSLRVGRACSAIVIFEPDFEEQAATATKQTSINLDQRMHAVSNALPAPATALDVFLE